MRYAIADIHGGNRTFTTLLSRINLRHDDNLFLLGDYVDRGPDSMGVMETLCTMKDAGYDIRPVRGNHEEMLLRTIRDDQNMFSSLYMREWGNDAPQRFGSNIPETISERYVNLLESMPYILVEQDYIFVHAGLTLSATDPVHSSDITDMLWSRNIVADTSKLGGRQLVTGHTIEPLNIIMDSIRSPHIRLDNGAFTGLFPERGNLVALNLDTKELIIQPWCDSQGSI